MAFLDNSGDIILDAVLTDTGRFRLAKGDGTFKIVKFALADDEIDYGTYKSIADSGSAYYDIQILQTPVLEAVTKNTSTMKSKLISVANTNLLYLPIMKINNLYESATKLDANRDVFMVGVNNDSMTTFLSTTQGLLNGNKPADGGNYIRVDQGLNTNEISPTLIIDPSLREDVYSVQMDNRLGSLVSPSGVPTNFSFLDDDNIAHYNFAKDNNYVSDIQVETDPNLVAGLNTQMVIAGPRGTKICFKIKANNDLASNDFLFNKLGSTFTYVSDGGSTAAVKFIDSTVRVMGATTGYAIDIPVRYIKK